MVASLNTERITDRLAAALAAEAEGRLDDARQAYEECVALDDGRDPDDTIANGDGRNLFVGWLRYGSLLHQLGEYDQARAAAERSLACEPLRSRAHALRGLCWMETGEFRRAEEAFRLSLALDARAVLWVQLSLVLESLPGRGDDAIDCLTAALEIDPESADAHYHLGCHLAQRCDYTAAIAHFESAVASEPAHVGGYAELGWNLYQRERDKPRGAAPGREALMQAEAYLRKAASLDPSYGWARIYLANFLWGTGRLRDANVQFKAAVRVWPEASTAHWCYGDFLATAGFNRDTAERFLRQAVRLDPHDREALHRLGKHLLGWGNRREARSILLRASEAGHIGAGALLDQLDRGDAGSANSAG